MTYVDISDKFNRYYFYVPKTKQIIKPFTVYVAFDMSEISDVIDLLIIGKEHKTHKLCVFNASKYEEILIIPPSLIKKYIKC